MVIHHGIVRDIEEGEDMRGGIAVVLPVETRFGGVEVDFGGITVTFTQAEMIAHQWHIGPGENGNFTTECNHWSRGVIMVVATYRNRYFERHRSLGRNR